jgi:hypothetical protein
MRITACPGLTWARRVLASAKLSLVDGWYQRAQVSEVNLQDMLM